MRKSICVVGGGMAGGIVSSTLAARGHEVTLLELGDAPAPYWPDDEIWELERIKAPFTRGAGLGGTTNFWHGGLTLLDRADIEGSPGGSDPRRSPMSYDRLRHYYAKAVALMHGAQGLRLEDIEASPDRPLDGISEPRDPFRLKALLYPSQAFGARPLIEAARRRHGLRAITGFEVKRLAAAGNRRVACAEGVDRKTGATQKYSADYFVVCAGGLGSPKVLLRTAAGFAPLRELPVGRFLIDHPTGFVFKAKLRARAQLDLLFGEPGNGFRRRYGFALRPERMQAAEGRNHVLYLRPAVSLKDPSAYDALKRRLVSHKGRLLNPVDLAGLLRHPDLLFDAVNFRYGLTRRARYVSGLVFGEQFPAADARMAPTGDGRFSVKWRMADADVRSLEAYLRVFHETYADLFETFRMLPGLDTRMDSAAHHSGGCRMALSATEGVVDGDLRVFGTENLFVADGSVLPYSGHANTGLTIAALALGCCDAIAGT